MKSGIHRSGRSTRRALNLRINGKLLGAGLLALLANASAPAQAAGADVGNAAWAKGRLLLAPRAGVPESDLRKLVAAHGGSARKVGRAGLYIVDLPAHVSEASVAAKLAHHPLLKFAELDMQVKPSFAVNDPLFASAWHLGKIGAPTAWDKSLGKGVTIAVLDTGVDGNHPDLVAQLVPGWNFYDNNSNTADPNGHGTWVAGAAAATANNALGVVGVAGQAKLMPLRIADAGGTGYWSMIAQAITYAADNGVRVVNISYDNLLSSSSIVSAAQYMKSKGGLVVVAAGNCGCNANLTASASMIPVSATDANDALTSFSSYGNYVALSAPGNYIYTTSLGGGYTQGIGTSFASPVVAGTVALMMSANSTLANTQVESLLYSTAVDLGPSGRDMYYGYGRVNAAAAVQAAAGTQPPAPAVPPTVSISDPLNGAVVSGSVPVDVSAADSNGVSKVVLMLNGNPVATDTVAPYAFSFDSRTLANGPASLTAVAYDSAGLSATSSAVSISVSNTVVADVTPPVAVISSPLPGARMKPKGSVTISGNATDDSGAGNVTLSLYIDNALVSTIRGGALSYSWAMNKVSSGAHVLTLKAVDASQNTSSTSITVTK